jgi:hypothetical protein
VVVGDSADFSTFAVAMRVTAVLFKMPVDVAELALMDLGAAVSGVSLAEAPVTARVLLFGGVSSPVGKVCDAVVDDSDGEFSLYGGVVEDSWLEAAICVGSCQGANGVVLLPLHILVDSSCLGEFMRQRFAATVAGSEATYLGLKERIPLSFEGKVHKWREALVGVEGVELLLCEHPSRVRVGICSHFASDRPAVSSPREMDLWELGVEVHAIKRGDDLSPVESRNRVVDPRFEGCKVVDPLRSGYFAGAFGSVGGRRAWSVVSLGVFILLVRWRRGSRVLWVQ